MKQWPVLTSYEGRSLLRVAMPLGGIGTGAVSIGGRGNLCDWEIMNRPGKDFSPWIGHENGPFFAVVSKTSDGKTHARMIEGPLDPADYEGPGGPKNQNHGLPRFDKCTFRAAYPMAQLDFESPSLPLQVSLQAYNPLIPAESDASGLPFVMLRYHVKNTSDQKQAVTVCGSLPNFIGIDGDTREINSASKIFFGGEDCKNRNEWKQSENLRGILMRSDHPDVKAEAWGTIALTTPDQATVTKRLQWAEAGKWNKPLRDFWDDLTEDGLLDDRAEDEQDRPVASLALTKEIAAGEEASFTFLLSWHFPNRYDWTPDRHRGEGAQRTWIGNYYCTQFADAWDAAAKIQPQLASLEEKTVQFVSAFTESDLPQSVKEAALYNLSTLRCQTCFRTPDGYFFGFEGSLPRSGSCYGNCTHVWNYEQATGFLFGDLSRKMRDLEFNYATDSRGMMNFRINLPLTDSLGFDKCAADGQMGCIMKLYRDWKLSGDTDYLKSVWPMAKKALEFCWISGGWDADRDGVMEGCQHNTMDVEYYGPNPQMTGWYIGALKAAGIMAEYLGETEFATECERLAENGSRWMDENLFNGSYYIQKVVSPTQPIDLCFHGDSGAQDLSDPDYQIAEGCLVDQLVGQYMAHICGLGYLHKPEYVRKTLQTIFTMNRKKTVFDHFNPMRSFVVGDENALLMAAFPEGKRPKAPFPYYAEVMTGFEYTAAVGMLYEGLEKEGMQCIDDIRNRYDGAKRSPFDETECGHHYARGMASWSAVVALTGFDYSALSKLLHISERVGTFFWSNGSAWGTYKLALCEGRFELVFEVLHGEIELKSIAIGEMIRQGAWSLSSAKPVVKIEMVRTSEDVVLTVGK